MDESLHVLIATLGKSSQVGTRTFDELYFKRQVQLRQVVWVHLSEASPLMTESVARVRAEVDTY